MRIKVAKGNFEIVQKKGIILYTDPLGAGIAVAFINKPKAIFGLLAYLFPTRDFDLNLDEITVYSGESLLSRFQDEIDKLGLVYDDCKWIIAGAGKFKSNPSFFDLWERNLRIVEAWFRRLKLWEKAIKRVGLSAPLSLTVLGAEGVFEIKYQNRVERYE